MTPADLALRPLVEQLCKAGIRTGADYDRLVEGLIGPIYAVPDGEQ